MTGLGANVQPLSKITSGVDSVTIFCAVLLILFRCAAGSQLASHLLAAQKRRLSRHLKVCDLGTQFAAAGHFRVARAERVPDPPVKVDYPPDPQTKTCPGKFAAAATNET